MAGSFDPSAPKLRIDGVMVEMYGGQRVRFSDGTTRSGLQGVILDGVDGRRIHLVGVFEPLLELLRTGADVRLAGDQERVDFVWGRSGGAGVPAQLKLAAVLSEAKSTQLRLVEEWERPESPRAPPGGPYASGLLGWMDEERPPRSPPAAPPSYAPGTLYARDGQCVAVWASQKQVRRLPSCEDLGGLEQLAAQGARVYTAGLDSWGGGRRVYSADDSTYVLWLLAGGSHEAQSVVQLEPIRGEPGELVGVAERGPQWIAHWRSGGRNWLALYESDASAVSGAMEIEVEGDLVSGGANTLTFLRWEGGVPIERTEVKADLEWRRPG